MVSVAGIGVRFPGCEGARALAARLRGGQAAGPLERRAGEEPRDLLRRAVRAVAREAVLDAGLRVPGGPVLLVEPGEEFLMLGAAADGAGGSVAPGDGSGPGDVIPSPGGGPPAAPEATGRIGAFEAAARVPADAHAPRNVRPGPEAAGRDLGPRGSAASPIREVEGALADVGWTGTPVVVRGVAEALEMARDILAVGGGKAVLIVTAAVRETPSGAPAQGFGVALEATGGAIPPSEGAVALVLTDGRHPGGRTRLAAVTRGEGPGARGLAAALAAAPGPAGLVMADGRREAVIAEATALGRAFREGPRRTALASARAWLGEAGAASDLAGLAAAALCLERRVWPAIPGWSAPGPTALREAGGLAASDEPAFWHATPEMPERRALVLAGGAVAALEAGSAGAPASATALCEGRPALLPLAAADRAGLEEGLRALGAALEGGLSVPDLARRAIARAAPGLPLRLALVAAGPRELRRELGFMRRALDKAEAGRPVRTPGGSVLAPRPIGPHGKVAFVYPGNGSAYAGLGREITLAFAGTLAAAEREFDHRLPELMGVDHVLPATLTRPSEAEHAALERRLNADMAALPLVGVAFSILHTRLMRDVLGLRPDMALGHSVGECAMRAALGAWPDWRGLERMLRHPVLLEGLSGAMTAVRRFWEERGAKPGEPPWAAHYVRAGAEAVGPVLGAEVFVQSVLSPGEAILCGAPRALEVALARLGVPSLPLDFDVAVHAPPARAVRAELEALCDQPTEPLPGTALLSAHGAAPVPQTREATARTLAAMLCEPVDFRALVERAYADGARIFVEVGVRNTCSGWVGATLEGREHLAVAVDVKGLAGDAAWMRAAAQLWAHRVPLDLGGLADGAPAPAPVEIVA